MSRDNANTGVHEAAAVHSCAQVCTPTARAAVEARRTGPGQKMRTTIICRYRDMHALCGVYFHVM